MSNTTIDIRISPSLHPTNVDKFSGNIVVITAFENAHRILTKIHDEKERISSDSSLSLEGQKSAIQRMADSHKAGVLGKFTAAITYLEKSGAALQERLQNTLTKEDKMGAEIRGHYKSTDKRESLLREVITNGDLQTISAVLVAPSYLSGLTDTQQGFLRAQYYESSQPKLATELSTVEAALKTVIRTQGIIPTEFKKAGGS